MLDTTVQEHMAAITATSAALALNMEEIATRAQALTGRYRGLRERAKVARLAQLDSLPAPAIVVSHNRILAANVAFANLLGISREFIEGQPWTDFIAKNDHDRTGVAIGKVDRTHTGFRNTLLTTRGPVEVRWAVQGVGEGRFYGVATPIVAPAP